MRTAFIQSNDFLESLSQTGWRDGSKGYESYLIGMKLIITSQAEQTEKDRKDWLACTPEERLDAVEILRLEAGKFLYEYPSRLRRVVSITRKEQR